jgi:methyl-accepting chemotaxis protein
VRNLRVPALVAGVACLTAAVTFGVLGSRAAGADAESVDTQVNYASRTAENALTQTFERVRTIALMLSREPSFSNAVLDRRARTVALTDPRGPVRDVEAALRYLATLLPGQVDSAGYADIQGNELVRWANQRIALPGSLTNVKDARYFAPAVNLGAGKVYRTQPYLSPTGAWVVTESTVVTDPRDGRTPVGLVSFTMTMDSLRAVMMTAQQGQVLRVVDAGSGLVVIDSRVLEDALMRGGFERPVVPDENAFVGRQDLFHTRTGLETVGDQRMSFATLSTDLEMGVNTWVIVASAPVVDVGVAWWVWAMLLAAGGLLAMGAVLSLRLVHERRAAAEAAVNERDRLAGRLDEMSDALSRVAGGELGVRLPVEGFDDENLTALAHAFDETLARLRVLVGQAQVTGDAVARSAAELKVLATEQADSAGEQSAAVVETTVTIEQLAATASQIAESAGGVADAAGDMLRLTEAGRTAVNDSVGAMDRIADRVGLITTTTTSLGEKVNEIGGILQLLDDLSDQTNLLALNAAIEAARAGEHGRGFSVVAGEVRKLAERARQSTGRIQGLVTEIHQLMGATLMASEQGVAEVERGSGLSADAVEALEQIAGRVEETATVVKEISVATQQQRSASDQVVVVMTRLSDVSHQYAAGSRQAASSADELAALAASMTTSIDAFRVHQDLDGHDVLQPVGVAAFEPDPVDDLAELDAVDAGDAGDVDDPEDTEGAAPEPETAPAT